MPRKNARAAGSVAIFVGCWSMSKKLVMCCVSQSFKRCEYAKTKMPEPA